jgi:transposase
LGKAEFEEKVESIKETSDKTDQDSERVKVEEFKEELLHGSRVYENEEKVDWHTEEQESEVESHKQSVESKERSCEGVEQQRFVDETRTGKPDESEDSEVLASFDREAQESSVGLSKRSKYESRILEERLEGKPLLKFKAKPYCCSTRVNRRGEKVRYLGVLIPKEVIAKYQEQTGIRLERGDTVVIKVGNEVFKRRIARIKSEGLGLGIRLGNEEIWKSRADIAAKNEFCLLGHIKEDYRDPKVLYRLYWEEGESARKIGKKFGVGERTILKWMEWHGIRRRTCEERRKVRLTRDELYRLYWKEGKSAREIGRGIGVYDTTVTHWLRKYDIPSRKGASREMLLKHEEEVAHQGLNKEFGKVSERSKLEVNLGKSEYEALAKENRLFFGVKPHIILRRRTKSGKTETLAFTIPAVYRKKMNRELEGGDAILLEYKGRVFQGRCVKNTCV